MLLKSKGKIKVVLILVLGVISKRGSPEVAMIGECGMRLGSRGVAKGL